MTLNSSPLNTRPLNSLARWYRVPASETEEGKKRLQEYYSALGHFIDVFAQVEGVVSFTLWHYAKTVPEIAKIVFSGVKIDVSSTYIKQLAAATKAPQDRIDDLADVLQQLGIINGVRNMVVHYGARSVAEGHGIATNELRAKGEPTVFPISAILLQQMTADLRTILVRLRYKHLSVPKPRASENRQFLDELLSAPWQYKHPPQTKGSAKKAANQPPRKRGPKQPHQPPS